MEKEHIVYRYTDINTGKVVYIGKTDSSLKARVNAHKREVPFFPYDCRVDFIYLANSVETDSVEKLLINHYKPVLNTKDKVCGLTGALDLPHLDFHPYEEYENLTDRKRRKSHLYEEACRQSGFLFTVLDGCLTFSLPFQIPDALKDITRLEWTSFYSGYQYLYMVEASSCEYLMAHQNECLYRVWEKYLPFLTLNLKQRAKEDKISRYLSFYERLSEFVENGYQMDEMSEPYDFIAGEEYGPILPEIESFFSFSFFAYGKDFYTQTGRIPDGLLAEFKEYGYRQYLRFYLIAFDVCDRRLLMKEGYLQEMDGVELQ